MKTSKYLKLDDPSAIITTGLVTSRKKSKTDAGYKYKMLTLKSFNENGYLDIQYLDEFISIENLDKKQITQEGDIVVRLSYPNTAVYITNELEGILITSLFIVIRIYNDFILPNYAQIYLNSEIVKKQLTGDIIGSAVSVVKVSSFKELKIPIYPIEYQTKVIELNKFILKEKDLLNQLIEEKTIFHKSIIKNLFE